VGRRRGKTGEGLKEAAGPLPSVAVELSDAEGAVAGGSCRHRNRVGVVEAEVPRTGVIKAKVAKIKVPKTGTGRLVSPGIVAVAFICSFVGRSESRAVELFFCGQRLAHPARVGLGLLLGDVNRPVEGQRYFRVHPMVEPAVVALLLMATLPLIAALPPVMRR